MSTCTTTSPPAEIAKTNITALTLIAETTTITAQMSFCRQSELNRQLQTKITDNFGYKTEFLTN